MLRKTDARRLVRPVALVGLLSCGTSQILRNGGFDLWCGEDLCSWEVEEGWVEKVPTWHEQEYGVAMRGDRTVLSQLLDLSSQPHDRCVELAVTHLGGARDGLEVTLDLMDDGTDELVWEVPPSNYDRQARLFLLPSWFERPRLRITKQRGQVVLGHAEMFLTNDGGCYGDQLVLQDRPDGVPCESASDCRAEHCVRSVDTWEQTPLSELVDHVRVCAECSDDADCAGSEVCGASPEPDPRMEVPRDCVPEASKALGELCAVDGECGTGVCCGGTCAECCAERPCTDGSICEPRSAEPERLPGPPMCLGEPRPQGAACLVDDDCASGACDHSSELRVCELDGRRCETDDDCRQTVLGEALESACVRLGALGGVCQ